MDRTFSNSSIEGQRVVGFDSHRPLHTFTTRANSKRCWHLIFKLAYNLVHVCNTGVDPDAARNREQLMMLDDANRWLITGKYKDTPHDKTGAMALHIAAAKGYSDVIRSAKHDNVTVHS